ncbi:anthocyanidin 3-O-glucoside 2'''-O-xylosyltransferase-like [Syzygium oleosum]|uniref:anthocyanidin 3-O-glucoside 2'''-O-xylosyltransferase-like n=1 Tax=Syzygium oleosum TaxID=219896 RepID=UPI0024BA5C15|nr:anthocyanidin 3-O-glucoside 2'''-O-xylosyltransferase-like [Syzygium oleosum]
MAMSEETNSKFHVAMFPWFAVGHMTPFLHLSNELAEWGHKISFFLPRKASILLENLNLHPDLIAFHPVTVPSVATLPLGTETASDIPFSDSPSLATTMDLTRPQLEVLLQALRPDFFFYDMAYWIPQVARPLGIRTVCYNVVSAATIAIVPAQEVTLGKPLTEEELAKPPEGYPSKTVVLRGSEARSLVFVTLPSGDNITFHGRITTAMRECDAIAMRTCQEIEGDLCAYISSQYGKPVFLTGPVLPEPARKELDEKWAEWLGRFKPGSVVFCAFGSQHVLEKDQFQELLLGFESTGLPFLVALRPPIGTNSVEEAFPEGFQERVQGRGVVHGGWVQQPLILSHPSVGCFVSHCGYGSMWESLMCDCQIVMVPHLCDQILNTRLLAEELKVGVEVEREESGWFSKESLCRAIKSVMDEKSEVGQLVKKNHAKWREALVSPNFISGYIDRFIQNLQELQMKN